MIHQYKAKGYNIVLDVYSGSVHLVDEISYDIISLLNKNKDKTYIENEIKNLHNINQEQFDEAYDEVKDLVDEKVLFSEDDFKDLTIDMDKRKTYL
ncbi:MAG: thioether cross-link-forming SCIFF peptide maturase, partial [Anaerococcus hydrogenalis]|nr:thioether cross-link-forming SCIFF peptide maturase [Anaerococcus hydrogenalis]